MNDIWKVIDKDDSSRLKVLIDADESIAVRCSKWGTTPLLIAAQVGAVECVILLVAHGADPNQPHDVTSPVSGRIERGIVPLMRARTTEAIRLLVSFHADVNQTDASGRTAIYHLGQLYETDLLDRLISCGAIVVEEEIQQLRKLAAEELSWRQADSRKVSARVQQLQAMIAWCDHALCSGV